MDSDSEVRREREAMSAAAGHNVRRLAAMFNEREALAGFFRRSAKIADEYLAADSTPAHEAEAGIIRSCRNRFGFPPRSLGVVDSNAFRLTLTPEVAEQFTETGDPILRILADQTALRDRGQVVWGRLVQANRVLFDPSNPHTLPAIVIYSLDPHFDGRASLLERMARGLFAQKGSVPADPELSEFVRAITGEREQIMRRELPHKYCGGRSVYFTTCFIQPSHLPGNCLVRPTFPLLVNFQETEAVMLLPSRFWPASFASEWRR